ncbi:MAG: hypothetical protein OJI74_10790, partial [Rhodanobacter thiooxydans]|nr:hypothetical protein [Rhodanobacter thiooxydans]
MQFAFIVDPLDALKPVKDSSISMMREAARRGHEIWTVQREALSLSGNELSASALRIDLAPGDQPWYSPAGVEARALSDFDAVLMRQDPPFDFEYITA